MPMKQTNDKVTPETSSQVDAMVIRIFKDRLDNIYVKTGAEKGFMVRITDGTRHDGTTVGSFKFVKEIYV